MISPPIHVTITWHLPPIHARILITSPVNFLCWCWRHCATTPKRNLHLTCVQAVTGSRLVWNTNYRAVLRDFSLSLQKYFGIVSYIKLRPLLCTSFSVRYSLILLSFDAIYSELLTGVFMCTTSKRDTETSFMLLWRRHQPCPDRCHYWWYVRSWCHTWRKLIKLNFIDV